MCIGYWVVSLQGRTQGLYPPKIVLCLVVARLKFPAIGENSQKPQGVKNMTHTVQVNMQF